jgi:hypothetical protein
MIFCRCIDGDQAMITHSETFIIRRTRDPLEQCIISLKVSPYEWTSRLASRSIRPNLGLAELLPRI